MGETSFPPESVEKVLRLFRQKTSTLRALTVGFADSSHTCADRSVFCLGRPEAKNGFQKPASRAKPIFSTSCIPADRGNFSIFFDNAIDKFVNLIYNTIKQMNSCSSERLNTETERK